jgi:hypothetical protein
MKMMRLITIVGAVALTTSLILGTSAPAFALSGGASRGNAAAAQYTSPSGGNHPVTLGVAGTSGGGPGAAGAPAPITTAGALPFTGYALVSVAAAGLCLLSAGVAVRRRTGTSRG